MVTSAVSAEPVRAKTQTIPMFPSRSVCRSNQFPPLRCEAIPSILLSKLPFHAARKKSFWDFRHRTLGSVAGKGLPERPLAASKYFKGKLEEAGTSPGIPVECAFVENQRETPMTL